MSSTTTGSFASTVNPACESAQSAETVMLRTSPSRKPTPAFSRNARSSSASSSTFANSTSSTPAQRRDGLLLGGAPDQARLDGLALGQVLKDADDAQVLAGLLADRHQAD